RSAGSSWHAARRDGAGGRDGSGPAGGPGLAVAGLPAVVADAGVVLLAAEAQDLGIVVLGVEAAAGLGDGLAAVGVDELDAAVGLEHHRARDRTGAGGGLVELDEGGGGGVDPEQAQAARGGGGGQAARAGRAHVLGGAGGVVAQGLVERVVVGGRGVR